MSNEEQKDSKDDKDILVRQNQEMTMTDDLSYVSTMYDKYQDIIGISSQDKHKWKKKLLQSSHFSWEDGFSDRIQAKVIRTDLQSITMDLYYGNWKTRIQVLITLLQEGQQNNKYFSCGSFGVAYSLREQGENYLIKSIQLEKQQQFAKQIFKQYFIALICSQLQVGPRIVKIMGYDIVFTKQKASFSMELCQAPFFQQRRTQIKCQLLQNIKVMHSLNIIHNDIKPNNIMFSPKHQKHVFIDFGLSRITNTQIGEKTLTPFSGTLLYSSEQMKKAYFCQSSLYVDLYYNDVFGCLKSLQMLEFKSKFNPIQNISGRTQPLTQEQKYQNSFISECLLIFNLKHCIYKKQLGRIQHKLQRFMQLPLSFCLIISSKDILSLNSQTLVILDKIKVFKEQVLLGKAQTSKTDIQLFSYFSPENFNQVRQVLLWKFWISNQFHPNFFKQHLDSPEFVCKLFTYLDVFCVITKWNPQLYIRKINFVISIIWDSHFQKNPRTKYEKNRFVINFFNLNFRTINHIQHLSTLRLLSIVMKDWILVEQLSFKILGLIQDSALFLLKSIQFYLFWKFLKLESDCFVYHKIFRLVQIKNINNESQRQKNFRYLTLQFLKSCKNLDNNLQQNKEGEESQTILAQIIQNCSEYSYSQGTQCIKVLSSIKQKQNWKNTKSNNQFISILIYSAINPQCRLENFPHHHRLCYDQIEKMFPSAIFTLKKTTLIDNWRELYFHIIQNQFTNYQNKMQLISQNFWIIMARKISSSKLLLEDIIFTYIKISRRNQQEKWDEFKFYQTLLSISYLLRYIQRNLQCSVIQQRMTANETEKVIYDLQILFQQILRKGNQFTSESKRSYCLIMIKIVNNFFMHLKNEPKNIIYQNIKNIFCDMCTSEKYFRKLLSIFLIHVFCVQDIIQVELMSQHIEPIIVIQQTSIFQQNYEIINRYILISNMRQNYASSLKFALIFVKLRDQHKSDTNPMNVHLALKVIHSFVRGVPTQKLLQIYHSFKDASRKPEDTVFAYFIFLIFLLVQNKCCQSDKIREIYRSSLSVQLMLPIFSFIIIWNMFRIAIQTNCCKTKRKMYICRKKLFRYAGNPNFSEIYKLVTMKSYKTANEKFIRKMIQKFQKLKLNSQIFQSNNNSGKII